VYDENERAIRFLDENLREGDVVVSHYLPSRQSVPVRFERSLSNDWFVCNVEAFILERKPALWIHGHTHDSVDYRIGSTRVVCNPLGYAGKENDAFDDTLLVEV
jgi:Icc-related predicted phosphoesterase